MTSPWRRRAAAGAVILGAIMFVGSVVMLVSPDDARRLHCDRNEARCILEAGGEVQAIDLSSIEKAYVSHSRASGYSLQLVTAKGTQILSKSTMHADSRREYEAAADGINALAAKRANALDVKFTHRAGLVPGIVIMFLALGLVAFGIKALRAGRV